MPRLKNRPGVFVVIFGILLIGLMGAAAISIDMSRIWAMRNELQTSADAGALAGAIQINPPHDKAYTTDSATNFAQRNQVLGSIASVDSVQLGLWDDDLGTFTNGGTPINAVHVVVSHTTNNLFIGMLGVAAPRVRARATAWADAPVVQATCVKPWSIPYVLLMHKLNIARGINPPASAANLTRAFDQTADVAALNTMTEAQRTFSLKMGSGKINDPPPGSAIPGNYNAMRLPRSYSAQSNQQNPEGTPGNGADSYRDNVSGVTCHQIGVGDSLETEQGNMVGPTIQGVTASPGICDVLVGEDTSAPTNDPSFGDCKGPDGQVGIQVKAAFHMCRTGCTGQSKVSVELLGSFTIKKVYPAASKKNQTPEFDKSEIVATFDPMSANGPVGPGPTTLRKLILVR